MDMHTLLCKKMDDQQGPTVINARNSAQGHGAV